ncbi:MAG: cytidylate kinase family protein, partial [Planctomycetota bacterium]
MGTRPTGPEIAKLVEKQMRNWELSRAQRAAGPGGQGGTGTAQRVAPFVAISRSVEAGGSEVARELGEALGWPVFDREILQAMAGDNEVRARLYENMDERDKSWIEDALKWLLRGRVPPEDYYYRVTEAVLAIQRQGPAVFLGRGADLILPKELGLRVRLDAP